MTSEFDDIEAFLQKAAVQADSDAIERAGFELDEERDYRNLAQVMVSHGLPGVHIKEALHPGYPPVDRVEVLTVGEDTEEIQSTWQTFADKIAIAKGFSRVGSGSDDPFALAAGREGLEAVLLTDALGQDAKQVAIEIVKEYLGEETLTEVLKALGDFDPTNLGSPVLEAQLALIQETVIETAAQGDLNNLVIQTLRPLIDEGCARFLPPSHDDFQHLSRYLELVARVTVALSNPEATRDEFEQTAEPYFDGLLGNICSRQGITFSDIKDLILTTVEAYIVGGYKYID